MTARSLCERIVEARGAGEGVVRIDDASAARVDEAARLFGLGTSPEIYREIPRAEARAVLVTVLEKDLAYGCELMPASAAAHLADEFLDQFDAGQARHFTNGDFGQPRDRRDQGLSWNPATDATFDTGILVLDAGRVGCAWFMDED